ncbi:class I SAM-dependent methyltransferase [Streptomyces sp. NPDC051940]|uniref:class I SAM-dependent methyltransferase n=1 Tax=Streptomyces sp. NPDC051940 TaxID=3155675 RepID=UPI0034174845
MDAHAHGHGQADGDGRSYGRHGHGAVEGHTAQAAHPYGIEWAEQAEHLARGAHADAGWAAARARELLAPEDRVAVDIGSGGGAMTLALASALRAGQVVAVDVSAELLAEVTKRASAALSGSPVRVEATVADLADGVGPLREVLDGPADLVWASACVHHLGDQQAAVDGLAALLAPGGRLALAEGGLRAQHLPWDLGVGEPGLEARLALAMDRWFRGMRESLPGTARMPYGWTEALTRAGLGGVGTRSTLIERSAPLGGEARREIAGRLAHHVERLRPSGLVEPDDLAVWDILLDESDSAWIGHRSDVFHLEVRSVHVGVRR